MYIVGTIPSENNGKSYFVGWDKNERNVYLSQDINGPWIFVEKDVSFESVAMVFAQNYVKTKCKQPQVQE